jgi:SnoaL-like domain
MPTDTPATIAAKLGEALNAGEFSAWMQVIADHVDVMNMVHDPSGGPLDGPMTQQQMRSMRDFEIEMNRKVFPYGCKCSGPIAVKGDDVITDFTITGKLADGRTISYSSVTTWTVKNGRIVSCLAKAMPSKGPNDGREVFMEAIKTYAHLPEPQELGVHR